VQAEKNAELDRMAAIATDTEFRLRHGMAAWHGSMAWQQTWQQTWQSILSARPAQASPGHS